MDKQRNPATNQLSRDSETGFLLVILHFYQDLTINPVSRQK
ncbi:MULTISPECIES: hypothetical protein [Arthrospira]|nr:hypothetical protein [Arthrospira platensis]MDF2211648.1 hypothetical protein [Arthrospira platensis NCB002]MDT9184009.1 hypothetical protein [Limnospira sp. PMC 289.06]MDT9296231.1 hypothetical protein [Arthrospira platensis PCC 7345]MDT9311822.1 hypothetical protein [Limnospira sp. Paracas R14]WAK74188.1 hypothetical protein AP9108_32715 [Arthrospira sp. PCC 9108]